MQKIEELSIPVEVMFVPTFVKNQRWDNSLTQEKNIYNLICDKKFDNKRYEKETNLFIYLDIELK